MEKYLIKIIINKHDFEFVTVFFVIFSLSEHVYSLWMQLRQHSYERYNVFLIN